MERDQSGVFVNTVAIVMRDADCEEQGASLEGKRKLKRRERLVRAVGAGRGSVCVWVA